MQGVSRIPKIAEAIEKLGRFGKRITPERIGTMTQRVIEAFEKWMKEQLA
ncbi:MAG TPA: hypothetical protein PK765_04860 [bacterium]|nr:hypothetical protein [bacterium]